MKNTEESNKLSGYASPNYARSLAEFGMPFHLSRSDSWILVREIAHSANFDAMGCYPLFVCQDWSKVSQDFSESAGHLISIALVTDPFGDYTPDLLRETFSDVMIPFKEHFIIDLVNQPDRFVSEHHRYYARKSLRETAVSVCTDAAAHLDDWCVLYDHLKKRHDISGISAFSGNSFEAQFSTAGLVAFKAVKDDKIIGMQLWYIMDNRAFYHLNAVSEDGYRYNVSYGMMWTAIQHFQGLGIRWTNLGAGAGLNDGSNGLTDFKRGWSNGRRQTYFCGKIINQDLYARLVIKTQTKESSFFPAYRWTESDKSLRAAG